MRLCDAPLLTLFLLCACSSAEKPVTHADIASYTGIRLCPGTKVKNLTSREESETVPGFSVHVVLSMPGDCRADFENKLSDLSDGGCAPSGGRFSCAILDASKRGATKVHTSIVVGATRTGEYDLRFYE